MKLTAEQAALAADNFGLAVAAVCKYGDRFGDIDNQIGTALEALCLAAASYDEHGERFSSYATQRIQWKMNQDRVTANRQKRGGGEVKHSSLDAPIGDSGTTFGEIIADTFDLEEETESSLLLQRVQTALRPCDWDILCMRLDGYPFRSIADMMGISRSAVQQRIGKIGDTLRRRGIL